MIEEDDITIYDSSVGMVNGKQFSLEIRRLDVNELIDIKKDILTNQKLRERIVDLADLWDGQESCKYGDVLQSILIGLEIKDVPDFYNNIDKIIDDFIKERDSK